MIAFIKGIVVDYGKDYLVVENNGIGYQLFFSKPQKITLNQDICVYTYQHVREDELSLYGFLSPLEKDIFLKLISVKGVGPKTAIVILGVINEGDLVQAIEMGDLESLKRLPGIGAKTASQIILDLKGKLVQDTSKDTKSLAYQEAIDALKSLGYRSGELQNITSELSKHQDSSTDELIKIGLQLLLKRRGG